MRMVEHFSYLPNFTGLGVCYNCNMSPGIAVNSYIAPGNFGFFFREDNCYISIEAIDFYLGDFFKVIGKMIVKQKFQARDHKGSLLPVDTDRPRRDDQFYILCGSEVLVSGIFPENLAGNSRLQAYMLDIPWRKRSRHWKRIR